MQKSSNQARLIVHAQHQHPRRGRDTQYFPNGLFGSHQRHLYVEEHHVGLMGFGEAYGFQTVLGLPDYLDVILGSKYLSYALAKECVIVYQKYLDIRVFSAQHLLLRKARSLASVKEAGASTLPCPATSTLQMVTL